MEENKKAKNCQVKTRNFCIIQISLKQDLKLKFSWHTINPWLKGFSLPNSSSALVVAARRTGLLALRFLNSFQRQDKQPLTPFT